MPRIQKFLGKDQIKAPFNPFRFRLICLGVLGCMAVLLARVADLQLINHPMLEHEADQRSLRTVTIPTNRGTLLDRNGETLALSVPSRDIVADPQRVLEANPRFTQRQMGICSPMRLTKRPAADRAARSPRIRIASTISLS